MECENRQEHISAMLVVCGSDGEIRQFELSETTIIGNTRCAHRVDIPVKSDYVEDIHGKIKQEEDGFVYQDLSGKGNTYHNGILLGSAEMDGRDTVGLREGDVLFVDYTDEKGVVGHSAVMIFQRNYNRETSWKSMKLTDRDKKFYISRHEEMKGTAEISNEDIEELPEHYALLFWENGHWRVGEHNTRLGVFLNNCKIETASDLKTLDVIRISNTQFLYRDGVLWYDHRDAAKNCLAIHIEERSVWNFFKKQVLLENIDLTIYPGEMVLILGGSGAGKTTFINAVMGYEKAKGRILEGTIDLYKNYNLMKYEIGFVPQQDLLRMEDRVYDTLDNAAELKLPKDISKEARQQRIEEVLNLFGLERERKSLVSKLSGGQRKRLSIAVEYIADPSLFFLDEPDSGLDGVMARSLMENLRGIADRKKMVLVITHSPDRVADLFDKVIVLAKGTRDNAGHLAFYGEVDEACSFFGVDSMEDIVRKINRTDEGGEGLADAFIDKYKEVERR